MAPRARSTRKVTDVRTTNPRALVNVRRSTRLNPPITTTTTTTTTTATQPPLRRSARLNPALATSPLVSLVDQARTRRTARQGGSGNMRARKSGTSGKKRARDAKGRFVSQRKTPSVPPMSDDGADQHSTPSVPPMSDDDTEQNSTTSVPPMSDDSADQHSTPSVPPMSDDDTEQSTNSPAQPSTEAAANPVQTNGGDVAMIQDNSAPTMLSHISLPDTLLSQESSELSLLDTISNQSDNSVQTNDGDNAITTGNTQSGTPASLPDTLPSQAGDTFSTEPFGESHYDEFQQAGYHIGSAPWPSLHLTTPPLNASALTVPFTLSPASTEPFESGHFDQLERDGLIIIRAVVRDADDTPSELTELSAHESEMDEEGAVHSMDADGMRGVGSVAAVSLDLLPELPDYLDAAGGGADDDNASELTELSAHESEADDVYHSMDASRMRSLESFGDNF